MRVKRYILRTLGALTILSVLWLGGIAAWIGMYDPVLPDTPVDAAIVLGAAAWGNRPSPVFRERIRYAVELHESNRVHYLIFTGGSPRDGYPSEGEVGRNYALRNGVEPNVVTAETHSRTTWQNLENIRPLLAQKGIRTVLLVSDPLHMRRAMLMADELGIQAYAAPTPSSRFLSLGARATFLLREICLTTAYLLHAGFTNVSDERFEA